MSENRPFGPAEPAPEPAAPVVPAWGGGSGPGAATPGSSGTSGGNGGYGSSAETYWRTFATVADQAEAELPFGVMPNPPAHGAFSAADALAGSTAQRLRETFYWRLGAGFCLGAIVLGLLQGWLWSAVAPTEQFKVFTDGTYGGLSTVSTHLFTDIAIFMFLAIAVGIVIAVVAWSQRTLRNPVMVAIVALSSTLGGFAAYLLGDVLASGTQPWTIGPSNIERLVQAPPTVGNATSLLVEPTAALFVYAVCALVDWLLEKDPAGEAPRRRRRHTAATEEASPTG